MKVFVVSEIDDFQGAVEVSSVVGVYGTVDLARIVATGLAVTNPLEYRVQEFELGAIPASLQL